MASNDQEMTRYRFECECNGEIPIGDQCADVVNESLGDALREALAQPGVTQVKRCIGYGGLWYVYI